MRHIHDDAELAAAVDRYVRPDNRYLRLLHGNFLRLGGSERTNFVQSLVAAARQATLPELTVLLEGEWRARLTGAVLAGIARRTALRDRIGQQLLASEFVYAGQLRHPARRRRADPVPGPLSAAGTTPVRPAVGTWGTAAHRRKIA